MTKYTVVKTNNYLLLESETQRELAQVSSMMALAGVLKLMNIQPKDVVMQEVL